MVRISFENRKPIWFLSVTSFEEILILFVLTIKCHIPMGKLIGSSAMPCIQFIYSNLSLVVTTQIQENVLSFTIDVMMSRILQIVSQRHTRNLSSFDGYVLLPDPWDRFISMEDVKKSMWKDDASATYGIKIGKWKLSQIEIC